jgi:hypothetical protein
MKTVCVIITLLILTTCCAHSQNLDSPSSSSPPPSTRLNDLYRQLGGFEALWRKNVEERILLEKNMESIRILINQHESKEKVDKEKGKPTEDKNN